MRELFNCSTIDAIVWTPVRALGVEGHGLPSTAQIAPIRDHGQKIKLDGSIRLAPGTKLHDSNASRIRVFAMSDNAREFAFAASRTILIVNHQRQAQRRHDALLEKESQTDADCPTHVASSRIRGILATKGHPNCTIRHIKANGYRTGHRPHLGAVPWYMLFEIRAA